MRIDRCICFAIPFEDLVTEARQQGVDDVPALQRIRPFGLRCGLCVPYVREALRTGETVFTRILRDDPAADAA